MNDLHNKVVFVTDSARRVGRAIALVVQQDEHDTRCPCLALTPNPSPDRAFGTRSGEQPNCRGFSLPLAQPRSGVRERGTEGARAVSE